MIHVTKRNGTVETLDRHKITNAMRKAFESTIPDSEIPNLEDLTTRVLDSCPEKVHVEEIQDRVENVLMTSGHTTVARAYILYRASRAEQRAEHLIPDPKAVSDYVHRAKYARDGTESYEETVNRVKEMHLKKYADRGQEVLNWIEAAFVPVLQKKVLPSMRSMQFAGPAIERHNARIYNCSFTLIDRPEVFKEIFYLLLCGCGVGFSVQRVHVENIPKISVKKDIVHHHQVQDTIEGWANAVDAVIMAAIHGFHVEFDYSLIRPRGSDLRVSGGKAPGHRPLALLLRTLTDKLAMISNRKLKTIEVYDMVCHIAEAVLSGGIRRSSLIALFSDDDEDMFLAKHPENFEHGGKNAQRAMSNNSVSLNRRTTKYEDFRRAVDTCRDNPNGEPGFFFSNDVDYGTNPCGEIGLHPISERGHTGFAFCNLCEVNMAAITNEVDFSRAVASAALIGTLQAGYTDFPFLGPASSEIAKHQALLGVGLTGMCDNPTLAFDNDVLARMRETVVQINREAAQMIGINVAQRVTTVKPSGTASLELGCVGSGIHPHHAKRYFRRITANPLEPVAQEFRRVNPHMVETKPNGDWCITFPVAAPDNAITVKDVTAITQLERVFNVYRSWIQAPNWGHDRLTHNVSCTVTYDPSEWEGMMAMIWENRDRCSAISFLQKFSDKGIPFMPREEVVTPEDFTKWKRLIKGYRPVSYAGITGRGGAGLEPACTADSCEVSAVHVEVANGEEVIDVRNFDSIWNFGIEEWSDVSDSILFPGTDVYADNSRLHYQLKSQLSKFLWIAKRNLP